MTLEGNSLSCPALVQHQPFRWHCLPNAWVMLWRAQNWDISLSPLHNPGATAAGQPLVPNFPWQKPKHHWYFAADGSVGHLVAFFSALNTQGAYRPPTYTCP